MALIKPVEELLKQITDEEKRKVLLSSFEEFDFLQRAVEGNLRQADYDRKMNEAKSAKETTDAYKKELEDWYAKNKTNHDELMKLYEASQGKVKELEEKVQAAVTDANKGNNGGTGVANESELMARVNAEIAKRGYVSSADVIKIAEEQTKKLVAEQAQSMRDSFYNTDFPNAISYMAAMNELQNSHREEFKKPLDPVVFSKFMTDEKIEDPHKAYDRFVGEERLKLKLEQATQKGKEEAAKEFASKYNLPGSGAPAAPELGPLQMRSLGRKLDGVPDAPADGSNQLAYAAAAELRAEGKI